jgi:hypothetical protein
MRRTVAALALTTALALSACTAPSEDPPQGEAPVVEQLTSEQAADQFQQITAPYDGVLSQFEEAMDSGAPLEQQAGLATAVAAALRARAEGLHKSSWPDEVFDDAHALATLVQQEAGHWEEAGAASSEKELKGHVEAAQELADGELEASVRTALGLADADG